MIELIVSLLLIIALTALGASFAPNRVDKVSFVAGVIGAIAGCMALIWISN